MSATRKKGARERAAVRERRQGVARGEASEETRRRIDRSGFERRACEPGHQWSREGSFDEPSRPWAKEDGDREAVVCATPRAGLERTLDSKLSTLSRFFFSLLFFQLYRSMLSVSRRRICVRIVDCFNGCNNSVDEYTRQRYLRRKPTR